MNIITCYYYTAIMNFKLAGATNARLKFSWKHGESIFIPCVSYEHRAVEYLQKNVDWGCVVTRSALEIAQNPPSRTEYETDNRVNSC